MSIGYSIRDAFTTSPAEKYRNHYKNLKNDLNSCISDIEKKLVEVNDNKKSYYKIVLGKTSYDSSYGRFVNHLYDKGQQAEGNLSNLINYWYDMLSQLRSKYQVASSRYNNLVNLCQEEDAREKEFTESEVIRRM